MALTAFDKFTRAFAPHWTLKRVRARAALDVVARHYEAAQPGRRTSGWARNRGDANTVNAVALGELRLHARDLVRNNGYAKKGRRIIRNNVVGWGIVPRLAGAQSKPLGALWKKWAESAQCESEGRHTFYGLQALAIGTLPVDGEVLFRRRWRRADDGLAVPLQLQVLEADFLDASKTADTSVAGGPIVQGVEYDKLGRRAAYWLFREHPGSGRSVGTSERVPASEVIHVMDPDRAGQSRGVSWLAASIVPLKNLDTFEDAELVRQQVAACFAAFITDMESAGGGMGEEDPTNDLVDKLEPGMMLELPPGKEVQTASPPAVVEGTFAARHLRKIAAGMGVTYEQLTGDYSQVNFSSARMSRLDHWADVSHWRWNMLVPQFCARVWEWFIEAAEVAGVTAEGVEVSGWTAPPMPMIEPDREGLSLQRLVRAGQMTPSEMVREQGGDPEVHWVEYAADLTKLDALGIVLDCDARKVNGSGAAQPAPTPPDAGPNPPAE